VLEIPLEEPAVSMEENIATLPHSQKTPLSNLQKNPPSR